jgi:hypothetical protein
MSSVHGAIVLLWNLVNREVADVNVGRQFRLERSSNLAKLIPDDATEEWMLLDLRCSVVGSSLLAEAVIGVTEKATLVSVITIKSTDQLTF